jgi:DNA polymerase III gamma/tau subunit
MRKSKRVPIVPTDKTKDEEPLAEMKVFFDKSLSNWRTERMEDEFYIKHRPTVFKRVKGQREAVKTLRGLLKKKSGLPHGLLFTGPSGCGKTTFAYILQKKIGCGDADFREYDIADFRGIDTIREMRSKLKLSPIDGKVKIYLLDEAHQLTTDAQNALLKMLEKCPSFVYIMLATTEPNKLKTTIKTRCTEIKVSPLADGDLQDVVVEVADKEKLDLSERVVAKICDVADGSARKALVLLNQIAEIEDEKDQLAAILNSDAKIQAIEIARGLVSGATWDKMCKILKGVDEEPEQLRYMILQYCTTILLSNNRRLLPRVDLISQVFADHFYDSKRNGLVRACYEVATTQPKRR